MAGLTPLGWVLLVSAFVWLGMTAAGPFVFLVRRFGRRPGGYPSSDDRLWLAFGLPWAIAALVRSGSGALPDGANSVYSACLFAGLAAASAPAVVRLWRSLSRIDALATGSAAPPPPPRPDSWTGRIGRAVAILWPLQFGLGLVVTR
jgi:hypothetical protein